jgi:hypothetical protein
MANRKQSRARACFCFCHTNVFPLADPSRMQRRHRKEKQDKGGPWNTAKGSLPAGLLETDSARRLCYDIMRKKTVNMYLLDYLDTHCDRLYIHTHNFVMSTSSNQSKSRQYRGLELFFILFVFWFWLWFVLFFGSHHNTVELLGSVPVAQG